MLDRKKDIIIRGGFNIYSAEIERVLLEHPQVSEVSVIGVPDARTGEVPVAFVVPLEGTLDVAALRAHADEQLGRLKRPEILHVVNANELPRNALGKVRKDELRATHANRTAAGPAGTET